MKKLEEQLSEANRRGDELQRTLTELSVAKNRLTGAVHQVSYINTFMDSSSLTEPGFCHCLWP